MKSFNRAKREQGAISLIAVFSMIIILVITSFAIDFGLHYYKCAKLQNAVDAATVAVASNISTTDSDLEGIANRYLEKNGISPKKYDLKLTIERKGIVGEETVNEDTYLTAGYVKVNVKILNDKSLLGTSGIKYFNLSKTSYAKIHVDYVEIPRALNYSLFAGSQNDYYDSKGNLHPAMEINGRTGTVTNIVMSGFEHLINGINEKLVQPIIGFFGGKPNYNDLVHINLSEAITNGDVHSNSNIGIGVQSLNASRVKDGNLSEVKLDRNGKPVIEQEEYYDSKGNKKYRDKTHEVTTVKTDADGNPIKKTDSNGDPVLDADGNFVYETVTTTEPIYVYQTSTNTDKNSYRNYGQVTYTAVGTIDFTNSSKFTGLFTKKRYDSTHVYVQNQQLLETTQAVLNILNHIEKDQITSQSTLEAQYNEKCESFLAALKMVDSQKDIVRSQVNNLKYDNGQVNFLNQEMIVYDISQDESEGMLGAYHNQGDSGLLADVINVGKDEIGTPNPKFNAKGDDLDSNGLTYTVTTDSGLIVNVKGRKITRDYAKVNASSSSSYNNNSVEVGAKGAVAYTFQDQLGQSGFEPTPNMKPYFVRQVNNAIHNVTSKNAANKSSFYSIPQATDGVYENLNNLLKDVDTLPKYNAVEEDYVDNSQVGRSYTNVNTTPLFTRVLPTYNTGIQKLTGNDHTKFKGFDLFDEKGELRGAASFVKDFKEKEVDPLHLDTRDYGAAGVQNFYNNSIKNNGSDAAKYKTNYSKDAVQKKKDELSRQLGGSVEDKEDIIEQSELNATKGSYAQSGSLPATLDRKNVFLGPNELYPIRKQFNSDTNYNVTTNYSNYIAYSTPSSGSGSITMTGVATWADGTQGQRSVPTKGSNDQNMTNRYYSGNYSYTTDKSSYITSSSSNMANCVINGTFSNTKRNLDIGQEGGGYATLVVNGKVSVKKELQLRTGSVLYVRGDIECDTLLMEAGSRIYCTGSVKVASATTLNGNCSIYCQGQFYNGKDLSDNAQSVVTAGEVYFNQNRPAIGSWSPANLTVNGIYNSVNTITVRPRTYLNGTLKSLADIKFEGDNDYTSVNISNGKVYAVGNVTSVFKMILAWGSELYVCGNLLTCNDKNSNSNATNCIDATGKITIYVGGSIGTTSSSERHIYIHDGGDEWNKSIISVFGYDVSKLPANRCPFTTVKEFCNKQPNSNVYIGDGRLIDDTPLTTPINYTFANTFYNYGSLYSFIQITVNNNIEFYDGDGEIVFERPLSSTGTTKITGHKTLYFMDKATFKNFEINSSSAIFNEDFAPSGTTTINSGSKIYCAKNATASGEITLNDGTKFYIGGNGTFSGNLTLNNKSLLICKGNFTCSGKISVNTGSKLWVMGNLTPGSLVIETTSKDARSDVYCGGALSLGSGADLTLNGYLYLASDSVSYTLSKLVIGEFGSLTTQSDITISSELTVRAGGYLFAGGAVKLDGTPSISNSGSMYIYNGFTPKDSTKELKLGGLTLASTADTFIGGSVNDKGEYSNLKVNNYYMGAGTAYIENNLIIDGGDGITTTGEDNGYLNNRYTGVKVSSGATHVSGNININNYGKGIVLDNNTTLSCHDLRVGTSIYNRGNLIIMNNLDYYVSQYWSDKKVDKGTSDDLYKGFVIRNGGTSKQVANGQGNRNAVLYIGGTKGQELKGLVENYANIYTNCYIDIWSNNSETFQDSLGNAQNITLYNDGKFYSTSYLKLGYALVNTERGDLRFGGTNPSGVSYEGGYIDNRGDVSFGGDCMAKGYNTSFIQSGVKFGGGNNSEPVAFVAIEGSHAYINGKLNTCSNGIYTRKNSLIAANGDIDFGVCIYNKGNIYTTKNIIQKQNNNDGHEKKYKDSKNFSIKNGMYGIEKKTISNFLFADANDYVTTATIYCGKSLITGLDEYDHADSGAIANIGSIYVKDSFDIYCNKGNSFWGTGYWDFPNSNTFVGEDFFVGAGATTGNNSIFMCDGTFRSKRSLKLNMEFFGGDYADIGYYYSFKKGTDGKTAITGITTSFPDKIAGDCANNALPSAYFYVGENCIANVSGKILYNRGDSLSTAVPENYSRDMTIGSNTNIYIAGSLYANSSIVTSCNVTMVVDGKYAINDFTQSGNLTSEKDLFGDTSALTKNRIKEKFDMGYNKGILAYQKLDAHPLTQIFCNGSMFVHDTAKIRDMTKTYVNGNFYCYNYVELGKALDDMDETEAMVTRFRTPDDDDDKYIYNNSAYMYVNGDYKSSKAIEFKVLGQPIKLIDPTRRGYTRLYASSTLRVNGNVDVLYDHLTLRHDANLYAKGHVNAGTSIEVHSYGNIKAGNTVQAEGSMFSGLSGGVINCHYGAGIVSGGDIIAKANIKGGYNSSFVATGKAKNTSGKITATTNIYADPNSTFIARHGNLTSTLGSIDISDHSTVYVGGKMTALFSINLGELEEKDKNTDYKRNDDVYDKIAKAEEEAELEYKDDNDGDASENTSGSEAGQETVESVIRDDESIIFGGDLDDDYIKTKGGTFYVHDALISYTGAIKEHRFSNVYVGRYVYAYTDVTINNNADMWILPEIFGNISDSGQLIPFLQQIKDSMDNTFKELKKTDSKFLEFIGFNSILDSVNKVVTNILTTINSNLPGKNGSLYVQGGILGEMGGLHMYTNSSLIGTYDLVTQGQCDLKTGALVYFGHDVTVTAPSVNFFQGQKSREVVGFATGTDANAEPVAKLVCTKSSKHNADNDPTGKYTKYYGKFYRINTTDSDTIKDIVDKQNKIKKATIDSKTETNYTCPICGSKILYQNIIVTDNAYPVVVYANNSIDIFTTVDMRLTYLVANKGDVNLKDIYTGSQNDINNLINLPNAICSYQGNINYFAMYGKLSALLYAPNGKLDMDGYYAEIWGCGIGNTVSINTYYLNFHRFENWRTMNLHIAEAGAVYLCSEAEWDDAEDTAGDIYIPTPGSDQGNGLELFFSKDVLNPKIEGIDTELE